MDREDLLRQHQERDIEILRGLGERPTTEDMQSMYEARQYAALPTSEELSEIHRQEAEELRRLDNECR